MGHCRVFLRIVTCVSCSAVMVQSQPALSGRVTDAQGSGLENAIVELKCAGIRVRTDSEGDFTLSGSTAVAVKNPQRPPTGSLVLRPNRVLIEIRAVQIPVCVGLFSFEGRRRATLLRGILEAGVHSVQLPQGLPGGSYFLKIEKGSSDFAAAVAVVEGNLTYSVGARFGRAHTRFKERAMAGRLQDPDTLIAFKYGYDTHTRSMSSLNVSDLVIQLVSMPPDSIVPPGMKPIPGGTFLMGSEKGISSETPVHEVTLDGFFIDSTEVTQMDYHEMMGVQPWTEYEGFYPGDAGAYMPTWYVNWNDAILYCNGRSKRDNLDTVYTYSRVIGTPGNGSVLQDVDIDYTKNGYRLPTEAEWEYAARGGASTEYYWGDIAHADTITRYAWWDGNSGSTSHRVATRQPNPYRLYDMLGNAAEVCNDWYDGLWYIQRETPNPHGPPSGETKVVRGGGWVSTESELRCGRRHSVYPEKRTMLFSYEGFRVVLPGRE